MEQSTGNIQTAEEQVSTGTNTSNIAAVRKAMHTTVVPHVADAIKQQGKDVTNLQHDLQDLINVGKIIDQIQLFGYVFQLRTLDAQEVTATFSVVDTLVDTSEVTRYNVMMLQILARSVVSVNGVALEKLSIDTSKTAVEQRLDIIKSWQQVLIIKLFDFYSNLAERGKELIDNGESALKN